MKNMRPILSLVLVISLLTSSVQADSNEDSILKSRTKAFAYSAIPTYVLFGGGFALAHMGTDEEGNGMAGWVGLWMIAGGVIVAPSLGHVYAERPKPFSGAALRAGLVLIYGAGISIAMKASDRDNSSEATGIAIIALAGTGWMASAIYDIVTAPRSASRYNKRVESFAFDLAPVYYSQQKAPGLAIRIGF